MTHIRLLSAALLLLMQSACLNRAVERNSGSEPQVSFSPGNYTKPGNFLPDTAGLQAACTAYLQPGQISPGSAQGLMLRPHWYTLTMFSDTFGAVSCGAAGADPQGFRVLFFRKSSGGFAFQTIDALPFDEEDLPDTALLAGLDRVWQGR